MILFCGNVFVDKKCHIFAATDLKRCHFGDTECLKKTITEYAVKYRSGRRDLGLVPIDPLQIDEVSIQQGNQSPVTINLKFKDMKCHGLSNAKVKNVMWVQMPYFFFRINSTEMFFGINTYYTFIKDNVDRIFQCIISMWFIIQLKNWKEIYSKWFNLNLQFLITINVKHRTLIVFLVVLEKIRLLQNLKFTPQSIEFHSLVRIKHVEISFCCRFTAKVQPT